MINIVEDYILAELMIIDKAIQRYKVGDVQSKNGIKTTITFEGLQERVKQRYVS